MKRETELFGPWTCWSRRVEQEICLLLVSTAFWETRLCVHLLWIKRFHVSAILYTQGSTYSAWRQSKNCGSLVAPGTIFVVFLQQASLCHCLAKGPWWPCPSTLIGWEGFHAALPLAADWWRVVGLHKKQPSQPVSSRGRRQLSPFWLLRFMLVASPQPCWAVRLGLSNF